MTKFFLKRVSIAVAFVGFVCVLGVALGPAFLETSGSYRTAVLLQPHTGSINAPESLDEPALAENNEEADEVPTNARAESCDHLQVMVGPGSLLPPDYVPGDLVYLSNYGIRTRGSDAMLRQEPAVQLGQLISAAAADGVEVLVASGYRSYDEQAGTFAWFENAYGKGAGKLSVPPGQSEHQLGTAVDFTSSDVDYELVDAFARTSAGVWLEEHAASYGFVLSYGKNQERETGVSFEPWHYRYVGVDTARRVEESGKSLTAFLAEEGVPRCYAP